MYHWNTESKNSRIQSATRKEDAKMDAAILDDLCAPLKALKVVALSLKLKKERK